MKMAFVAAAAVLGLSSPALAATNLVTNGGFETVAASLAGTSFEFGASYAGRSTAVTGWTSANASAYNVLFNASNAGSVGASTRWGDTNEYLWNYTGGTATTGNNFVALDGDSTVRGALTQMINGLTVGQTYALTFDWAAGQFRTRDGATTEQLQVGFGNSVFNTSVISNANHGFSGWRSASTTFTATSTSQLLSFLSIGTPNGLPPVALLDNVSLTAVPETSTWIMMILGFGMVGGAVRRRRVPTFAAA